MFGKKAKICLSWLLAALLLFPIGVSGQTVRAEVVPPKTDAELQEAMKQYDGPYPVYIYGKIPGKEFRDGGQKFFNEYVSAFIKEEGLDESQFLMDNNYTYWMAERRVGSEQEYGVSALIAVWMTKEEIYRVADSELVTSFGYVATCNDFRPIISYSFQPIDALRILQVTVGFLSEFPYMPEMDVNMDGHSTPLDALLALQESVGLTAIAYPAYLGGYRIGEPQTRYLGYDWELKRIPQYLFMHADDVNGDGNINEIDILIKYNHLWV